MEKYTEAEWLDILLGEVDMQKVLTTAYIMQPDKEKLIKKLTAIADPAEEEVNVKIWDLLRLNISAACGERAFGMKDEKAWPDDAYSLEEVACRHLAGLLAERIQATREIAPC